VRPDAIVATGRSDYPNQVNNVLGFPFIFRGALDVRATTINDEMKIAAAQALAELARQQVPEEVAAAYGGKAHSFGVDYIIPAPFDPRLMEIVPAAVAKAAMDSGVAQKPIADIAAYRTALRSRLNPTTSVLTLAYEAARANPKRVIFAEGEEEAVLRAGHLIPRRRLRHARAGRARGRVRQIARARRRISGELRGLNSRTYARVPEMVDSCTSASSGRAICRARSSGWSTRTATRSARCCCAGRGRRDGDRHHPALCADHAADQPGDRSGRKAPRRSASTCWSAARTPASWPTRR
jgi:hypothetical protein